MSEPAVAVNVIVPVSLPDAGLRANHAAVAAAFQLNVPLPMFVTVRVCVVGLLSPCWALKERLLELTPIAGLGEGGVGRRTGGAASGIGPDLSDTSTPMGTNDG